MSDPTWLAMLRRQADRTTTTATADMLGLSRTMVSLVLAGKYLPLPTGTKVVDGYTVIGHHQVVPNAVLQAYCHPVVTNNDLWIAGVGWGIGFLVLGIIFFWQAESKYGRG